MRKVRVVVFIILIILLVACQPSVDVPLTATSTPKPTNTPIPPTATVTPFPPLAEEGPHSATVTPFPPLAEEGPHLLLLLNRQQLLIYDKDGSGRQIIELPPNGNIFSSLQNIVSPNGRWLVFFTGSIGNTGLEEELPLTINLLNLVDGTVKKVVEVVQSDYQQKLEQVSNNLKTLYPNFYKPIDNEDWVSRRIIVEFAWAIKNTIAWSPDSQKVAFAGQIDGLSSDVYIYSINENNFQQVNNDLESVSSIEWSPDGKYIVFENAHVGDTYTGTSLHVLEPNQNIVENPKHIQYGTWWSKKEWLSPHQLLISEGTDTAGDWDLKILNVNNSQVTYLWMDAFYNSSVDIENQIILLNSSDFTEDENMGVYFVKFDGEKQKILDGLYYFDLIFRGGKKHRFVASGNSIVAKDSIKGVIGISLDGEITLLSQIQDRRISVSPDFSWLLVYNEQEVNLYDKNDNFVKSLDISGIRGITWRPDSQGFFYSTGKELYFFELQSDSTILVDQCVIEDCYFSLSEYNVVWTQ